MSNPLFCAKCGGDLKHTNNGYKCSNCDNEYPQSKTITREKQKGFIKEP